MAKRIDLLNGPILATLAKLAAPIMATGFIQMAYNLTDMIWLGRLGAGAVTAAGLAGMFLWLASGLALLVRMGTQVKVGQATGAGNPEGARAYAAAGFQLDLLFAIAFTALTLALARQLIAFFNLSTAATIRDAVSYLYITCGLCAFGFVNMLFTGILNALGDSRTPFYISTVGLAANIILDPLLIFGIGFPALGVAGAAIATVIAQVLVTVCYIGAVRRNPLFAGLGIAKPQDSAVYATILRIGAPSGLQSMAFSLIAMVISRQLSAFGDAAIGVQKVGTQIESISWMTADGFGSAVNAFTAQNYGAGNYDRIAKGFRSSLLISVVWGTACVALLTLFPRQIFALFIDDPAIIGEGAAYLRILGLSELLNVIEITSAGIFDGLGKTLPPSITSIALTAIRIPLVAVLSAFLGLNGAWWSCSISCMLKGAVLLIWLLIDLPKIIGAPAMRKAWSFR